MTPWVLLRFLGVRGAVMVAVAGNLVAAASVLLLLRTPPAASAGPAAETETRPPERRPFGLWMTLYALSGFCALALEILLFRVVDVGAKGTAFTFGTVLAIYLLGSAAGALLGATWADRLRRLLLVFTALQAAILSTQASGSWPSRARPRKRRSTSGSSGTGGRRRGSAWGPTGTSSRWSASTSGSRPSCTSFPPC